jgi:formate dehydrogenase subunit beta
MSEALKINKGIEEAVQDLLESLFKAEKIKGVFTLRKMNDNGGVAYSLISSVEELQNACPLYPFMPVNAGTVLSDFTIEGSTTEPVAAILRPCELRAFTELVKRIQANPANILLISVTCGGVFPLKSLSEAQIGAQQEEYWESMRKADIAPGLRETCQMCEDFVPQMADMVIAAAGRDDLDKQCTIILQSQKGQEYGASVSGSKTSDEVESAKIEELREKRKEQKTKIFEKFDNEHVGLKDIVKTFAPCLGCHGCSHVCPICCCTQCEFDSKILEYQPSSVKSELMLKGGLKVPPGNIFFHLGRMSHMAVSCVSCGMCSDVCPVNIPVATIFSRVSVPLQEIFEYIPGRDVEEPVPSGTFKEQEFVEIGEH